MKHTQGEWEWKQNRGNNYYEHSVFVGEKTIAELTGGTMAGCTKNECKANARLIAAAPALLGACEVALLAMTHEPLNPEDVEVVKAAIAATEGD